MSQNSEILHTILLENCCPALELVEPRGLYSRLCPNTVENSFSRISALGPPFSILLDSQTELNCKIASQDSRLSDPELWGMSSGTHVNVAVAASMGLLVLVLILIYQQHIRRVEQEKRLVP